VTRVRISAFATSASQTIVYLYKRSSANSRGTSANPLVVKHDPADLSPTAVVTSYTSNPTSLGTEVGVLRATYLPFFTAASPGLSVISMDFGENEPVILNGIGDVLAVGFNAGTIPAGAAIAVSITWGEDV